MAHKQTQRITDDDELQNRWGLGSKLHTQGIIAVLLFSLVLVFALWPLMTAPNSYYPVTVDGLGHLAKVEYIAKCLKSLQWPSWFPYWYNGASVVQYYPPLSYFLLAPVQMLFGNIMITFKFAVFFYLLVGAMGVWYICYRYWGSLIGIAAGILYVLQPFILRSMASEGVIAQGPIFALSPWLLVATLLFIEKRSPSRAVLIVLLSACLILSHAMHAFITCLAMGVLVLMLVVLRRTKLKTFLIWSVSIGLGAALASFWWVPGVTHLENPSLPYMLPENMLHYTAYFDWFYPGSNSFHYFSPIILLLSLGSVLFIKKNRTQAVLYLDNTSFRIDTNELIISFIFALIVTIVLSFGYHISLFRLIPSYQNILPGRVLSFAAILAAILCTVFLWELWSKMQSGLYRILRLLVLAIIIVIIAIDINPKQANISYGSFTDTQAVINLLPSNNKNFNNSRIAWLLICGPDTTYFPMLKGFHITSGWNIEGTPHNRAIRLHNIAVEADCGDYVTKNLMQWNVRSAIVQNDFCTIKKSLLCYGFKEYTADNIKTLFVNPSPSSYFMKDERNAIAIGKGSPGLVISFPWLVQGTSSYLEDYSLEDLKKFRLIYLSEPQIKDFNFFQDLVSQLAETGKTVFVEMGHTEVWPLFGIIPYWENIAENAQLISTEISPIKTSFLLQADPIGEFPAMGNLDGVWMEVVDSSKHIPAIGYKNIKGNKVYFVGMCLGMHLDSSVKWSRGLSEKSCDSKEIYSLLMQLMELGKPNKSIIPLSFPINNDHWRHDGFDFSYKSTQPTRVVVSVTYTPRWKALIDGQPLLVQNQENLILLDLPAGQHSVVFHYGMTWVGWLGIGLSIFSLLIAALLFIRWEYFNQLYEKIMAKIEREIKSIDI
ncbi:6-pyruvoyl-tetrahydropterin synthase-related protein [Syntrophomonas wolfei]|uniref:6-pyruvoyl-tetrahydropterin synthase-related protein n=1 Tax=Syntrophomonas wolfei TaxID=863 RepID=UPI0003064790|nr:6-pyruvoyl-tetrahydropterin synthase-related protein [Syntrophomonas wolfei]